MIDVVIANPPFFENVMDAIGADSTRSYARPPPKSASSAARNESQTVGGEVGFARRLAEDSLRYRGNVKVFTIMLGKKRSVPAVRRIMKEMEITQTSVYEMCQGRVMRWGFAWTFLPNFRFPVSEFQQKRKFHRPPLTYTLPPSVSCLEKYTRKCLLEWIRRQLLDLKMSVILQKNKRSMGGCHLRAKAKEDTWTHSRRKRREALLKQKQSEFQQQEVLQVENGERKRRHSTGDNPDPDENPAKRCRMDEICDGDMSWIEELCRRTMIPLLGTIWLK
nr:methyltransferase protein 16 [Hymenolepis microstoma]